MSFQSLLDQTLGFNKNLFDGSPFVFENIVVKLIHFGTIQIKIDLINKTRLYYTIRNQDELNFYRNEITNALSGILSKTEITSTTTTESE